MTDAARTAPRPYTLNHQAFEQVSLPANHVLVSDQGITFSKANVPIPVSVVKAAKGLCAALTEGAVPAAREEHLAQAQHCGEQLSALGALVSALNEAKAKHPDGESVLDAVSAALNTFCQVFTMGYGEPTAREVSTYDGPWHKAVLDACMVRESRYVPDDPARTVRQLLQWEFDCALDPAVSARAAELADTKRKRPFYTSARSTAPTPSTVRALSCTTTRTSQAPCCPTERHTGRRAGSDTQRIRRRARHAVRTGHEGARRHHQRRSNGGAGGTCPPLPR
ncbi:hypothetical protein [Paraburkholderia youngii]|uniref:hypothetical protein n=1 Tax=Paraburkholderia youngii TaxID=2782701 RepID=UPI003D1CA8D8